MSERALRDVVNFSGSWILQDVLDIRSRTLFGRVKLQGDEIDFYNGYAKKYNCRSSDQGADASNDVGQIKLV